MNQEEVIRSLCELPDEISDAETKYYDALHKLKEEKQNLQDKEYKLFHDGKVNDKNAFTRNSSLFPHTKSLQREVMKWEFEADRRKVEVYRLKKKLESELVIAQLISNENSSAHHSRTPDGKIKIDFT
jgi:hypothetical protein